MLWLSYNEKQSSVGCVFDFFLCVHVCVCACAYLLITSEWSDSWYAVTVLESDRPLKAPLDPNCGNVHE